MKKMMLPISIISLFVFVLFAKAADVLQSYAQKSNTENILFIMDSSFSMSENIGTKTKIQVAKETVNEVLSNINIPINMGLRVYGHKDGFLGIGSCKASELMVPIGENNTTQILRHVNNLNPEGWTPITYSLKQAVNSDLKNIEGKKRIILLSDGQETCDESPCEYVLNLVKTRPDIKIDVIGFSLDDEEAVNQLKCTALVTKGQFFQADDKESLKRSLSKILNSQKDVHGLIVK